MIASICVHFERLLRCRGANLEAVKLAESLQPDVVLLSSEPFPFRDRHLVEVRSMVPSATVELVDGEVFSWYGSRMRLMPPYLTELRASLAPAASG